MAPATVTVTEFDAGAPEGSVTVQVTAMAPGLVARNTAWPLAPGVIVPDGADHA